MLTLIILCSIGVGNVWGASPETFTTTSSGGFSKNSKTIAPITVTMRDGTSTKTSWQTAHVRVYTGGGVTISSSDGNITKIEFTCTANKGSNYGPDKQKLASGSSGTYSTTNGSAVGVWTPDASGATNIVFNATAQIRFTQIVVTYEPGCTGTQLGTPVVTATPSDGQVILSWPDVSNASSYQLKWNGGDWVAATSPVTKTSLTNGTAYTYQVKAIGNGSTYCDGDASEEASVTPNVFRTITYYDKDGQHTTSLADGTNIADALNALYGVSDPTSCDAVNYGYFVGWKVGEISGTASSVTLLDDEVVNASSPSNNYYAVWSDTDPASAGGWTKVGAGELAVGDKVVFVYAGATNKEMTGVASNLGTATSITTIPDDITGVYVLTVEAGNGGSGYSFKNGSNYLSYSGSNNNLYTSTEKNNNSSWTISTSTDGNYKFANVGTTSRILQYNSGQPRWACYTSSQSAFQIYKQSGGGDAEYITSCQACTAPDDVNISGGYHFYPGETIELTATPTGSPSGSPVTYQWKHNGTNVGTNSSTYTKTNATAADAGSYTCTITYGSDCSTTSSGYNVKCMQFYLKNSSGGDISNHPLVKVDATHATLSLNLTGGTTYKFRVTDGCNDWYGNTGEMTSSNCTNWTMPHDADCRVTTGSKTASYTFNFDFSNGLLGSEMKVSVVYPSANQAAGKVIYWDNEVNKWDGSKLWYRIGKSTHNTNIQLSKVAGTANFYSVTTSQYDGFDYWHIANNEGNGNGNIFWTKGDAAKAITNAMGFEGAPVTDASVTVTPTTSHSTGGSSDNDNCEFYTYSITSGVKSYTVTSSATNCTVAMEKYNNDGGSSTTALASGGTVMPTQYIKVTVTPNTGYQFTDLVVTNGTTVTAAAASTPGVYYITGNATVTATCSLAPHTVTWYAGGTAAGNITTAGDPSTSVEHGSKVTKLPTNPDGSACDKVFVGWTNTSSYVHGTSLLFNDVSGSPVIDTDASFYAVFATESGTPITWNQITDATNVTAGTYVIVASTSTQTGYLPTATASSSGPLFTTSGLTIADGKITSTVTDAMKWTFSAGSWDDEYKYMEGISITNQDATPLKLYNISNNNGVRVNSPSDQTWTIGNHESGTDDVLYMWCNSRYCGVYNNADWRSYTTYNASNYETDAGSSKIKLFKQTGGTTYTGHTINCADCGTSVTPTYTAAPTGGTVSVTKSAAAVASGSTVKTCTAVDLTVTITPATHYTLTGFTATGLTTGTATISPVVAETLPKTTETTFTVTVSAGATGTLNLTPTFTEDTKVAITWNVNGVNQSIAATEGLTWVYSGGDLTALPSNPSVPAGCSGTKVFAGWSTKHSDATEEDASFYDDLFTAVGDAPTGISSEKTFYAVFATSSANPLAGTVIWDEPFTGFSANAVPTAKSSGATVYNSTELTYACADGGGTTKIYSANLAGGTSPELLVAKSGGSLTVSNIPTAGQTELTLSYKANNALEISSGTSGVMIGDASVEGKTYTRTITISQSPAVNNFSLAFTKSTTDNARLDDIHLVVPGSGTMTDYVTLCAPSWTITYDKNTSDPVTNLPSPTSVLQSTGSGTLSNTVPERATYTFGGWAETTSGAVAYVAGGNITGVSADKTLYAVWTKTPVEELLLNYSELNKYVGDPAVTLEVTGVTPEGADASVTWSSSNSSVASVVAATGVVTFGTVGTATITATSTVTGTTTAYCHVTVRNKPTATFVDLIHDGNGTDLSTYNMQNVAGTAIVFPTLDDYATPGDDCDTKHYVFVGWTTSDNNDDPQDHLVASGELEDGQDKVFYAVWADGVEGVSYTKLTSNSFDGSPAKYVIGVESGGDTYYLYDCASTDANNSWGYTTNAPGTNAPIQFTLSGTADALVATSTEASARYLKPLTARNFQMSATSKTVKLNSDGTIHNTGDNSAWNLRGNSTNLRWYDGTTGTSAYFYKITAGAAVSYRTSCCTNNVPAPTVIATNTAYTVTLTWAAVDGATGYEVSWNGGAFEAATSPCVKSGLTASTDYIYKVRATYDPLVKCGALVASGNVTTDDVYSVTYSGGTGTGSCSPSGSVAPVSYEAGATVTLAPTNSFSMTSNTFAAWVVKDADDNVIPVSNNQFTMPAKNVTVTATWTAVQDKYYDRMHDGTDALHGGIADGEGKYYLVLEGCNYTVPALTDDAEGDTECHTTHFKLLGWIAQSRLKTDGSGEIKPGEERYIFQGGGTKSATGATYYAIWAIMTE